MSQIYHIYPYMILISVPEISLSDYVFRARRALWYILSSRTGKLVRADGCSKRNGVIYCGCINANEGATAIPGDSHGLHRQDTFTVSIIKASLNVTFA